jgi:uncharacterized protein YdcH (DUF465 family)
MSDSSTHAASGNPLLDLSLDQVPEQWREHARELRRENARFRDLLKQYDETAQQKKIDDAVKTALSAHEQKSATLVQAERDAARQRVVQAEVRAAAGAAGIRDLDALKLLDLSAISVDAETGEVNGVKAMLDAFKKDKPYLFQDAPRDTTQTRRAPMPADSGKFDARKATREELEADAKARGLRIKHH